MSNRKTLDIRVAMMKNSKILFQLILFSTISSFMFFDYTFDSECFIKILYKFLERQIFDIHQL